MNEGSTPATFLVVDDHDGFRASAVQMLGAYGYSVLGEAADGESALRAVRDLRPDAVLLDVQLPDIDGFEVSRRLIARASGSGGGASDGYRPRIVLISSRERSDYGPLIENCGCDGFISKGDLSQEAIAEAVA